MLYFLIPCYNESGNIRQLVKNIKSKVKKNKFKIILIDDGSTDNTKQIAKNLSLHFPLKRLGYTANKGPGFAFKVGFDWLIPRLKKSDLVITMEADNTSDYKILLKMIANTQKFDLVLASPYAKGGSLQGVPAYRVVLSKAANLLDALVFQVQDIKTYSSFYRAYRSSILKKAKKIYKDKLVEENGFSVFVENLIKLNQIGASMIEVPAIVNWQKRQGKSKLNLFRSIKGHLSLYFNYLNGKYKIAK